MKCSDFITSYNSGMTSVLKFFILYILSKWYGISFSLPFLFLFLRVYQIIINKIYKLSSLSLQEQYLILKYLLNKKIKIKEITLKHDNNKEDVINILKDFLNKYSIFKRTLVYKWNNYYWRKLTEQEIGNNIFYNIESEKLEKKLKKEINLLKEYPYKIFLIENKTKYFKIIFKFNSLIKEKYFDLFNDLINGKNNKVIIETKRNKIIKLFIDFLSFPLYLIFETLIILLLSIKII